MNIRLVCVVVCLLLPSVGCRHSAPAPDEKLEAKPLAKDFYPLKVGNQWTFEIRAQGEKVQRTISITNEKEGFFIDNTGAALRQDATGLRDRNRYLLENPIETGRKWLSVQSPQSTEYFEITSVGGSCSTKAGTFPDCVTVKSKSELRRDRTLIIESTYAKNVGLVSLQTIQLEANGTTVPQVEIELVSYKVAP